MPSFSYLFGNFHDIIAAVILADVTVMKMKMKSFTALTFCMIFCLLKMRSLFNYGAFSQKVLIKYNNGILKGIESSTMREATYTFSWVQYLDSLQPRKMSFGTK
jgi:hypothetical protein